MRYINKMIGRLARVGIVFCVMVLVMTGCESTATMDMPKNSPDVTGQTKNLKQLTRNIMDNQKKFVSLVARCRVKIKSPLFGPSRSQLTLRGKLKLLKPRKILLVLRHGGQEVMRLVGNGEQYRVEQTIFNDTYGGKYDSPLTQTEGRLHFMPDDLADAFDLRSLFYGRPQVLQSYPQRWDIAPGSVRSPVQYPPVWMIDSLNISPPPNLETHIDNSVMINRRNEKIMRIDKFRDDASLRVRIWHLNTVPVRGSKGGSLDLPRNVFLWYPPPLEGTMINIRMEKYKVNVSLDDSTFELGS